MAVGLVAVLMPAPAIKPAVDFQIDVLPSGDPRWPWKTRITSRDASGQLVGVRNLRALTEAEANDRAQMLRGRNAQDDIADLNEDRPA